MKWIRLTDTDGRFTFVNLATVERLEWEAGVIGKSPGFTRVIYNAGCIRVNETPAQILGDSPGWAQRR